MKNKKLYIEYAKIDLLNNSNSITHQEIRSIKNLIAKLKGTNKRKPTAFQKEFISYIESYYLSSEE